tara:strand:- start:4267 stop:5280 length:1014 start_codon:yes stop_codon:yes gene_type:complete
MQIQAIQLEPYLEKHTPQFVLLYGNDPFLIEHSRTTLLQHYADKDISEKEVITFENKNNALSTLHACVQSPSLFATQRVIICLMSGAAFTKDEKNKFAEALRMMPPSDTLIFVTEKVTKAQQKDTWYQYFSNKGVVVSHWPLAAKAYQTWLGAQAHGLGIRLNNDAIQTLAQYTQGNVLAGRQMLEQLVLLNKPTLETSDILEGLSYQNKYEMRDLYFAILEANINLVTQIMAHFKSSHHPLPLILWGLHQLVQQACSQYNLQLIQTAVLPRDMIFQRLMQQKMSQISQPHCQYLLKQLAHIDKLFKTHGIAQTWHETLSFCLNFLTLQKNVLIEND